MAKRVGKLSSLVAQFESLERDKYSPADKRSSSLRRDGRQESSDSKPDIVRTRSTGAGRDTLATSEATTSASTSRARPLVSQRSQSILDKMAMFTAKSETSCDIPSASRRLSREPSTPKSDSVKKSMERFQSSDSDTSSSKRSIRGQSPLVKQTSRSRLEKDDELTRSSRRSGRAVASQGDSTPTSRTEVARSAQPSTSRSGGTGARQSSRSPSLTRKQKSPRESSAEEARPGSPVSSTRRRRSSTEEKMPAKARKSSLSDSPLSSSPASSVRRKRPSTEEAAPSKARKSSITDSPTSATATRRRKSSTDEGIATGSSTASSSTQKSSSSAMSPASRRSSTVGSTSASRKSSASGSTSTSWKSSTMESTQTRRKSSVGESSKPSSRTSPTTRRRRSSSSPSLSSATAGRSTPDSDSAGVNGGDIDMDDDFGSLDVAPRLEAAHQSHRISVAPAGRRKATQNPIKTLQTRKDVVHELKPSADQVGKQVFSKSAQLAGMNVSVAASAVAGLAARENISAVKLSTVSDTGATVWPKQLLIHIKGRRSLQTRVVEPNVSSINSGDSFLLVDSEKRALYQFIGKSANVVERAKSADMVMDILHGKDCGSKAAKTTVVEEGKISSRATEAQFWKALTGKEDKPTGLAAEAGEDLVVEKELISKTVVYELEEDKIVLCPDLCGKNLKYAMLDPKKVMVFDFVNEVVSWTGRRASNAIRKCTAQLTKEVFDRGYIPKEGGSSQGKRPSWAQLIACKDGSETILFRSKVHDWPDRSKVINTKATSRNIVSKSTALGPCNGKMMRNCNDPYPGLTVLQRNLGRGNGEAPSDDPCLPGVIVKTESVKKWKVKDNTSHEIPEVAFPDFYEEDAYIVRWEYSLHSERSNIKSGVQTKQVGSNQNIFFYWQGSKARTLEKGTAAMIVIELSGSEGDPQIRVAQGSEPPAFLQMFDGSMAIHTGSSSESASGVRLYAVHGTLNHEGHLEEIPGPITYSSLRSRHCFVIADSDKSQVYTWYGKQSTKSLQSLASRTAGLFADRQGSSNSYAICKRTCIDVTEVHQRDSSRELSKLLPGFKESDLEDEDIIVDKERGTRMFLFSVASGSFDFLPLVRQWRYSGTAVSFPATQSSFYGVDQPSVGLVEAGDTLYVWCGWVPEMGEDDRSVGGVKSSWLEKKKLAFQTAMSYLTDMRKNGSAKSRGVVVTAGYEPSDFRALFLHWQSSDEAVQAVNKISPCSQLEPVDLEQEMEAMQGVTYPLDLLRTKPLPDSLDVDPKTLEKYLNDADFELAFSMDRAAFEKVPAWKQLALRKKAGLF